MADIPLNTQETDPTEIQTTIIESNLVTRKNKIPKESIFQFLISDKGLQSSKRAHKKKIYHSLLTLNSK